MVNNVCIKHAPIPLRNDVPAAVLLVVGDREDCGACPLTLLGSLARKEDAKVRK